MRDTPVRQFECESCGAPAQMLRDSLVVMCERCGCFVGLQAEAAMDPEQLAKRGAESLKSLFAPTDLQARQTEATLRMTAAQNVGDRARWHLWANEYYTLASVQMPETIGAPKYPAQRAQWLRHCLAVGELTAFDPGMKAINQRNVDAMLRLYQTKAPIEDARACLDAGIAVQRYLDQHPEVPEHPQTTSAEHRATESFRMVLAVASITLGADVIACIRTEVLGDDAVRGESFACAGCGGEIPNTGTSLTCPFCGVITQRATTKEWVPPESPPSLREPAAVPADHVFDERDPWVRQTVALWDLEQQRNPGATPLGTSAVGFVMSAFHAGGVLHIGQALAFLRLLRPTPPPSEIVDFARTMRTAGVRPSAHAVLDAIIETYGG